MFVVHHWLIQGLDSTTHIKFCSNTIAGTQIVTTFSGIIATKMQTLWFIIFQNNIFVCLQSASLVCFWCSDIFLLFPIVSVCI